MNCPHVFWTPAWWQSGRMTRASGEERGDTHRSSFGGQLSGRLRRACTAEMGREKQPTAFRSIAEITRRPPSPISRAGVSDKYLTISRASNASLSCRTVSNGQLFGRFSHLETPRG